MLIIFIFKESTKVLVMHTLKFEFHLNAHCSWSFLLTVLNYFWPVRFYWWSTYFLTLNEDHVILTYFFAIFQNRKLAVKKHILGSRSSGRVQLFRPPVRHPSDQYHEVLWEKGYYFNCHLRIVKESICSNKVYPVVKKREVENNNSKGSFNVMRKFGPLCHFH